MRLRVGKLTRIFVVQLFSNDRTRSDRVPYGTQRLRKSLITLLIK